jgi:hypothetical protein
MRVLKFFILFVVMFFSSNIFAASNEDLEKANALNECLESISNEFYALREAEQYFEREYDTTNNLPGKLSGIIIKFGEKQKVNENFLKVINRRLPITKIARLPLSFTTLGSQALTFDGISFDLLTSFSAPGLVTIEDEAFKDHKNLTSLNLPIVEVIGNRAFEGCSSLLTIPEFNNVKSVGKNAFTGCPISEINGFNSITSLFDIPELVETLAGFEGINEIGGSSLQNSSVKVLSGFKNTTSIKEAAFLNCLNLNSLPSLGEVKSIESRAFENCRSLTSSPQFYNVLKIGDNAFANCFNLETVSFSDLLEEVGEDAFNNTNVTTLNLVGKLSTNRIKNVCAKLGEAGLTSVKTFNFSIGDEIILCDTLGIYVNNLFSMSVPDPGWLRDSLRILKLGAREDLLRDVSSAFFDRVECSASPCRYKRVNSEWVPDFSTVMLKNCYSLPSNPDVIGNLGNIRELIIDEIKLNKYLFYTFRATVLLCYFPLFQWTKK